MLNRIEIALWLNSPVTIALLKNLGDKLTHQKDLLTQGYTLNPESVAIDTAKAVGRIEILDLIVNRSDDIFGVEKIEE